MDIKRVGPPGVQPSGVSGTPQAESKRFRADGAEHDSIRNADLRALAIPDGFSRADLGDEQKVAAAVRYCVDQLVRSASEKVDGGLGDPERAHLGEVLQNDPGFRSQVLRYLDQVLK